MIAQPYRVYVERREAGRNMARFYALSIEQSLFGQPCLVRRWGRIGTSGRMIQQSFEREDEAVDLFLSLLRSKRSRGYRPPSALRQPDAASPGARPLSTGSVPVGSGPDQGESFSALHLNQGRVDRTGETRVIQLHRDVVTTTLF